MFWTAFLITVLVSKSGIMINTELASMQMGAHNDVIMQ